MENYTNYNTKLKKRARSLRKNGTFTEDRLWYDFLRSYPIKFYRQRPIGNYIVDFYSSDLKLVIELDGKLHEKDERREYDERRTKVLESYGLRVMRITNWHVALEFETICKSIDRMVDAILATQE